MKFKTKAIIILTVLFVPMLVLGILGLTNVVDLGDRSSYVGKALLERSEFEEFKDIVKDNSDNITVSQWITIESDPVFVQFSLTGPEGLIPYGREESNHDTTALMLSAVGAILAGCVVLVVRYA